MAEFQHKGERFDSKGLCTSQPPDALDPGQYAFLKNVRGYSDGTIMTRPGYTDFFTLPSVDAATNAVSYGNTGSRYLASNSIGGVVLDTGSVVDTGFGTAQAPGFLPYRPNQSSQSWVYASNSAQYRKYRSPDSTDAVLAQKVGIIEPQVPVDAAIYDSNFTPISTGPAISYVHGGTAGVITDTPKVADTVTAVFQDPALPSGSLNEYIVQTTSATQAYQKAEFISIGPADVNVFQVKDVFLPLSSPLTIDSIAYFSGATGSCVIVPSNVGITDELNNVGQSIFSQALLASIRRGTLITLGGTETVMVLGVANGINGSIAIYTSTASTHAAGEQITGNKAIRVTESSLFNGGTPQAPTAGQTISAHCAAFNVGTGVGWIQSPVGTTSPFSANKIAYQSPDYLHFSVWFDDLSKVTECKIMFDIGDGSFTQNFFYMTLRPADFVQSISNTLTQLGSAQLSAQRQQIDLASRQSGVNASSYQTAGGNQQWSDVVFPISELTRVGNDQTLSLLNVNSYRVQVQVNANVNVRFHTVDVFGGYSADIGNTGIGFKYRIRPRSSLTGAKGNPSPEMRYFVNPRRDLVKVITPTTYSDTQMDLWDIFRIGGTLDKYTLAGTVDLATGEFLDNYASESIVNSEKLEYDNLEPWPTVDVPLNASTATATGTLIRFSIFDITSAQANNLSNIQRYLPGNIVKVGQQTYTLYKRPSIVTSTVIFEVVENAGDWTSPLDIYEPLMAAENLPIIWGPTEQGGTVFAAGSAYRPGNVSFCENFNPDSAPSKYTIELSVPSDPITAGELLNGESFAFSPTRCWALRPSFGGVNQYSQRQVPTGVGCIGRFAICSDGKFIYFVAKDGIYATGGGEAVPLTTRENIYSLFPHDGIVGDAWTYAGQTVYPPNYNPGLQDRFRLAYCNGHLYFDYPDTNGAISHLVYDIRQKAWYIDTFSKLVNFHYGVPQNNGQRFLIAGYASNVSSHIVQETLDADDFGDEIDCFVATRETTEGDLRSKKLFGDVGINLQPIEAVSVTPYTLNAASGTTQVYGPTSSRLAEAVVSLGGGTKLYSLGLTFSWTHTGTGSPTTLFQWVPSIIDKPETIVDRATDWTSTETLGNKFFQGLLLECDAYGQSITFNIQDADTMALHGPFTATFDGQQTKTFSFDTPFLAHSVRLVPVASNPFEIFTTQFIYEPYPEAATTWRSEGTGNFFDHFQNIDFMCEVTHVSTAPWNIIIRLDSATVITLPVPASGAGLDPQKTKIAVPPQKWKIASFEASSDTPFYLFADETFFWIRAWASSEPAHVVRPFGGNTKVSARI
jgi:hypothetical protein